MSFKPFSCSFIRYSEGGLVGNTKSKMSDYFSKLPKRLLDEKENKKIIGAYTYAALGGVSLVMTIMNIVTDKGALTIATAVFAVLCCVNLFLNMYSALGSKIASSIFVGEVLVLFTFFLVSGNPEGFSAIWICMLPFVGMLVYDRKISSIISLAMFVILVVLLWTPFGNSLLAHPEYYTDSFKARFPILFTAYYVVALFLETLRAYTHRELAKLNNIYLDFAIRDQLTQIYNRKGLFDKLETHIAENSYDKIGIVIFDIDFFKKVNDDYGHLVGDEILKDVAKLMKGFFNAYVCRWGGEEFSMVYFDGAVTSTDMKRFLKEVENCEFSYNGLKLGITMSAGVYETSDHDFESNFNEWVRNADLALYQAKEQGRNRVIYY